MKVTYFMNIVLWLDDVDHVTLLEPVIGLYNHAWKQMSFDDSCAHNISKGTVFEFCKKSR